MKKTPVNSNTMPAQSSAPSSARLPSALPTVSPRTVELTDATAINTIDVYKGTPMYKTENPIPKESKLIESAPRVNPHPRDRSSGFLRCLSRRLSKIIYVPRPISAKKPMYPATSPKSFPAAAPRPTPKSVIMISALANANPIRILTPRSTPRIPTPTQIANTSRASERATIAILRYGNYAALCVVLNAPRRLTLPGSLSSIAPKAA